MMLITFHLERSRPDLLNRSCDAINDDSLVNRKKARDEEEEEEKGTAGELPGANYR